MPYIVGNISDMKALIPIRQYRPPMPTMHIAPIVHNAAPVAKIASRRLELTYFIKAVAMNLPQRKSAIAMML